MSNIIPKEQMSAYQRWELDSLAEPQPAQSQQPAVALPTAEDIQQIQQQAHQEGRQEGYQEGLRMGREEGYREGRQAAEEEAQRLHGLMAEVDRTLQSLDQAIAPQLLDLALGIAKQMLRQALQVRPELLLPVVREAINSLPQAAQHPRLTLHPRDAALVRTHLEQELSQGHWQVTEDSQIEPGGCRLETAQSELDATLESRWRRVLESLGKRGDWLEPE